jgi:DNA-binding CsgD family transcriptional regulator
MTTDQDPCEILAALTDKQRETLDLLAEPNLRKQVAYKLGISEETVKQRFRASKRILGGVTRTDVLQTYKRLCAECAARQKTAENGQKRPTGIYLKGMYPLHRIGLPLPPNAQAPQVLEARAVFTLSDAAATNGRPSENEWPLAMKGLEALDRQFGFWGRLLAIIGGAALLTLITLAMVVIGQLLSTIF